MYTAIERKINGVNLIASFVLGHPKCFRRPKTTYWYPTPPKSGGNSSIKRYYKTE